jgi:hypothetical protein
MAVYAAIDNVEVVSVNQSALRKLTMTRPEAAATRFESWPFKTSPGYLRSSKWTSKAQSENSLTTSIKLWRRWESNRRQCTVFRMIR